VRTAKDRSTLRTVLVKHLRPNPFRRLDEYPIDRAKVAALKRSFAATGYWSNIVGRPKGTEEVEIAYGHHRLVALQQSLGPDAEVEIIIRDLTNDQMLRMMAQENLDEWGGTAWAEVEAVRATLDAAARGEITLPAVPANTPKENVRELSPGPVIVRYTKASVAQFLGWAKKANDGRTLQPNAACEFAFKALDLIELGKLKPADLKRLTRREGEALVDHEWSRYRWEQQKARQQWEEAERERQRARWAQPELQRAARHISGLFRKTTANGATEAEAEAAAATARKLMADNNISEEEVHWYEDWTERANAHAKWVENLFRPRTSEEWAEIERHREEEKRREQEERKQERHAAGLRNALYCIGRGDVEDQRRALKTLMKRRDELTPEMIAQACRALDQQVQHLQAIRATLATLRDPPAPAPGPGTDGRAPEAHAAAAKTTR
jgi:hypothetical protein